MAKWHLISSIVERLAHTIPCILTPPSEIGFYPCILGDLYYQCYIDLSLLWIQSCHFNWIFFPIGASKRCSSLFHLKTKPNQASNPALNSTLIAHPDLRMTSLGEVYRGHHQWVFRDTLVYYSQMVTGVIRYWSSQHSGHLDGTTPPIGSSLAQLPNVPFNFLYVPQGEMVWEALVCTLCLPDSICPRSLIP